MAEELKQDQLPRPPCIVPSWPPLFTVCPNLALLCSVGTEVYRRRGSSRLFAGGEQKKRKEKQKKTIGEIPLWSRHLDPFVFVLHPNSSTHALSISLTRSIQREYRGPRKRKSEREREGTASEFAHTATISFLLLPAASRHHRRARHHNTTTTTTAIIPPEAWLTDLHICNVLTIHGGRWLTGAQPRHYTSPPLISFPSVPAASLFYHIFLALPSSPFPPPRLPAVQPSVVRVVEKEFE